MSQEELQLLRLLHSHGILSFGMSVSYKIKLVKESLKNHTNIEDALEFLIEKEYGKDLVYSKICLKDNPRMCSDNVNYYYYWDTNKLILKYYTKFENSKVQDQLSALNKIDIKTVKSVYNLYKGNIDHVLEYFTLNRRLYIK